MAANLVRRVPQFLRRLCPILFLLTLAVFVGPALFLGAPDRLKPAFEVLFALLATVLVGVQLVILVLVPIVLLRRPVAPATPLKTALMIVAPIAAVANATRLELGVAGSGVVWDFGGAALFAMPLALFSWIAGSELRRTPSHWWVGPMGWILLLFPVTFLVAGLARIDFSAYTGVATPNAVAWGLAYVPTLLGVALGLTGWWAFEQISARPERKRRIVVVTTPAVLLGILAAQVTSVGFILTATITWGSGYQLFVTPQPLPPLAVSIVLATLAFSGLLATIDRLRREKRPVLGPILAFTAILTGVFPTAVSVLGSLAALELLWLSVVRFDVPS